MANRYGISVPQRNLNSLQRTSSQIKEAIEALLGYRGGLYADAPQDGFEDILSYLQSVESRLLVLETVQQVLVDGVYAHGNITPDTPWNPGVTTPTTATRLPIDTINIISNVDVPNQFAFVPLFSADYTIDLRVHFDLSSSQNNRNWTVAVFDNGVQAGAGYDFNTRDITDDDLFLTAQFGAHLDAGDEIDVRLWPDNGSSTLVIADYSYYLKWEGLDNPGGEA